MNSRILLQLLTLVTVLFGSRAQAAVTVTLQQGLNGYAGTTDTYLSSASKTTNYGTATSLQDQTNARGTLVKFAIFQSEGGPVPNGATIQSATLSLYKSSGGATTYGAYRLLKTWTETQATWNRATTSLNWTVAGATGSGTDLNAASDGSGATTSSAGWMNVTVTGGVAAIATGAANNGWRLMPTSGATNTKSFYSRQYTSNTALRPKLVITYDTATVPGAPTIGAATAGNAQATVSFTAPASNGGSVITGYTVTSSPGNLTASGTASPITVTGLTNGTAYTFTVTATNAIGTGPASAVSNSVTPATVPGAPTVGTATAGNAHATVSFTAPADNGGSAITGYTVTSSPDNLTASGTASPITITGLTNGTAYTFTVTATNAVGSGTPSAASNRVTPTAPLTDAQTLYFVHPDHLGTPRLIANGQGTTVWTWDDSEPFGNSAPNQNPNGLGSFVYNPRFPGQYYDTETGLHYNTFRDYDPVTGRYVQSDPIGLDGGISTYAYVENNPLAYVDPLGLVRWEGAYELSTAGLSKFGAGYAGVGGTFTLMSDCVAGVKGMAQVRVKGSGFGYGGSLLGFFSIGTSTVKFEDGLSFVDPDVFNGAFYMEAIGTIFYSSTANFRLGGAVGDGSGFGIATDIYSVYGANGESTVINKKLMPCDCPKP